MKNLLKTAIGRLRFIAFAEGVSFLIILFVTMPLKYIWQIGMPNKIVGLLHGFLFVSYIWLVIQIAIEQEWKLKKTLLALLASIVPFGTFWADKHLFNQK